jgi:hypothetical protein
MIQFDFVPNNAMNEDVTPSLLRCDFVSARYLSGASEFFRHPLLNAGPDLFSRPLSSVRIASDVSYWPKTYLNLDMPSFGLFGILADGEQVNFIDAALNASDGEEIFSVEPFVYKLLVEERHSINLFVQGRRTGRRQKTDPMKVRKELCPHLPPALPHPPHPCNQSP